LKKVNLPIFKVTTKGEVAKAWLENMHQCFKLWNYSSNQKAKLAIYQLKESALLWWRKLESQLGYFVGYGIPQRHVLGLKAQVFTKSFIKAPRFVGAEREVIIE